MSRGSSIGSPAGGGGEPCSRLSGLSTGGEGG
jgi:hypothetical protein